MSQLLTSTGAIAKTAIGSSFDIRSLVFHDALGVAIAKAAILSLTFELQDQDGTTINGWNGDSILDANGGTVETDGTAIMRLQPADTTQYGTQQSSVITAIFTYTWSDGVSTRTGKEERTLVVTNVIEQLVDADGEAVVADVGESLNIAVTFANTAGTQLTEANLATILLYLYDRDAGTVIRASQSVKDASIGTLAVDGTLTLRFATTDTVIAGTKIARLTWTYSDTTPTPAMTRTGIQFVSFVVT